MRVETRAPKSGIFFWLGKVNDCLLINYFLLSNEGRDFGVRTLVRKFIVDHTFLPFEKKC